MTVTPEVLPSYDPRRTAVINVHWQHDMLRGHDGPIKPDLSIVDNVVRTVSVAREHGALVVFARAAFRPGYPGVVPNCALFEQVLSGKQLQDGSPGAEIIPELAPRPEEPILTHISLSAFMNTELNQILRARDIAHVLVTGVLTNISVEGTARDAVQLGYRAVLVADACWSIPGAHEATLATFQMLGSSIDSTDLAAAFTRG